VILGELQALLSKPIPFAQSIEGRSRGEVNSPPYSAASATFGAKALLMASRSRSIAKGLRM